MLRLTAVLVALVLAPAGVAAAPKVLLVAAAANLKGALGEAAAGFQAANPGVDVRVTYGSSGNFHAQILNGAPFDLFVSADEVYPRKLEEAGLAVGEPFTYATGKLVLWVPKSSPLDVERQGLGALLDPSVRRIAIANPALAPYGRAARAALESAGLHQRLESRLVLGESVTQAAQFAQSGSAEAALLPLSLVLAPPLSTEGRHVLVPAGTYPPIVQAGVVLAGAKEPKLASAFARWLLGPDGRAILEKYGYGPPSHR